MIFRFASAEDAGALLAIYAQYIGTDVTFEYSLPGREEFARRIRDISAGYPYLVCEEGGRPVGYAYAHRHMEREAYQWNAELSVYLDGAHTGRGVGRALCGALFDLLALQGVRSVYSCVTLPNPPSERMHAALGFSRAGTFENAGYKNGAWHSVAWFRRDLLPHGPAPAPLLAVGAIPPQAAEEILKTRAAGLAPRGD